MNITVELRDEGGRPLLDESGTRFPIMSDGFEFAKALPKEDDLTFPYLRLVDPWGVTVFNRVQMSVLIPELERVGAATDSQAVKRVLEMARICESEVHSYLAFMGD